MFKMISFAICLLMLTVPVTAYQRGTPTQLYKLDQKIGQVVFVTVEDKDASGARIDLWERGAEGIWELENRYPISAVIGRNGLADAGEKIEGDGRTPSGMFNLRRAFGYDEAVRTGLNYTQVSEMDFWIDDPDSSQYNQWVHGEKPFVSHEILRRDDDLYKLAVIIEYNMHPIVEGKGSAIFLHIWRGEGQPTAGCVATEEKDMVEVISWLDAKQYPVVILSDGDSKPDN